MRDRSGFFWDLQLRKTKLPSLDKTFSDPKRIAPEKVFSKQILQFNKTCHFLRKKIFGVINYFLGVDIVQDSSIQENLASIL